MTSNIIDPPSTTTTTMKSPDDIRKMLDPSKMSFSLGKPLSEEEFKRLCQQQQIRPQIHKVDSQKK